MTTTRKIVGRRQPIVGYIDSLMFDRAGYLCIAEKRVNQSQIKVVVADASAYKTVRKIRSKMTGNPFFGYARQYHGRLLFGTNINNKMHLIVKSKSYLESKGFDLPNYKVLIADSRIFRVVRKKNVKPLAVERLYRIPHSSHRMNKWQVEPRSYTGGEPRFYRYRGCKNCEAEQAYCIGGTHEDETLFRRCTGKNEF